MNITIEKDAAEYIREKSSNNSIYLTAVTVKIGWSRIIELSVKMGRPIDEEEFDFYKSGEISVYILKTLTITTDEVEISLKKILFIKNLSVKGVSI